MKPIVMCCDNVSTINISHNHVMHSKIENVFIKYHFLQEELQENMVLLEYASAKEQDVDIFTKVVPEKVFNYLKGRIWVIPLSIIN